MKHPFATLDGRKWTLCHFHWSVLHLLVSAWLVSMPLQAEEVLFIGNSFTNGHVAPVRTDGGIPKLVEHIAKSKGRELKSAMSAPDGFDWDGHRKCQATIRLVEKGGWKSAVLQNLSTMPTRLGNPGKHVADGAEMAEGVWKMSPGARIVLYETWPRHARHPFFREGAKEQAFGESAEMMREIREGYATLFEELRNRRNQVAIARVGDAFERCRAVHPEIEIYHGDLFHANPNGSYLAALVLYASLFDDSPLGATREFPSFSISADIAEKLQKVADAIASDGEPAVPGS